MDQNSISSRIEAIRKKYGSDLVILGHHYQADEVVEHVDIVGDSLELARRIPDIEARNIVFCGVFFMAESASLLARPGQKVFLPDHSADCAMARMAKAEDVEKVLDEVIFIRNGEIVRHTAVEELREQYDRSVDALFREEYKC